MPDNFDISNLLVIKMCAVDLPVFKEDKRKDWILFGEKNDYPKTLLELYNGSAKHNALINGKVNFIYGGGLQLTNEADNEGLKWFSRVNRTGETLNDISRKSIHDVELHGGFYWQIIPTGIGFEIYHCSFENWRSNKDNTMFYYKADWANNREEAQSFPAFNPLSKVNSIYFFKQYRPGVHTYCLPDYLGAINFINADIEVSKHTYTNASAGFNATKFINFYNGTPADDKKRQIEARMKDKFTGSMSDKIIIGFNDDPTKRPTVDDLGASDLTKEDFTAVDNLIQQNIFSGHQITSPMLFGIKTEGQLGGRDELRTAFEIFKNTYSNNKQQQFERIVNMFAGYLRLKTQFTLKDVEPVGFELSEATLLAIAPKEYLLEKAGIDISKYQNPAPAVIPTQPKPAGMKKQYADEEVAEMFSSVGKPRNNFIVLKTKRALFSSDEEMLEDELKFFEFDNTITQIEANILDLISKDKRVTPETIAKTLDLTISYVQSKMNELNSRGLISIQTITENDEPTLIKELTKPLPELTKEIRPETVQIFIRYSYEVAPGNGPAVISTSRPFCKKMIEMDKFYSRSEIQSISGQLGYSVWDRRGGFWNHNGTVSPTCRHIWKSNVVAKKQST